MYDMTRDIVTRTVAVTYDKDKGTFQRADTIARGAFKQPIRFVGKTTSGGRVTRNYTVEG